MSPDRRRAQDMDIATPAPFPKAGGNSCAAPDNTAFFFLSLGLVCGQKGRQGPNKADRGPEGGTRMLAPARWQRQWPCWARFPPCHGFSDVLDHEFQKEVFLHHDLEHIYTHN